MRRALVPAVFLLYAAVILYPVDWAPPRRVENGAEQLPSGAWRFAKPGLVRTRKPLEVDRGFVARIRARPATTDQTGPARMLTISRDASLRNLTIGQDGSDLIVRLRAPGRTRNGLPEHRIKGVFADTKSKTIQVTVDDRGVDVSVDGVIRLVRAFPSSVFETWDSGYRLALGNELTGRRAWLGELTYDGDVPLERPETFWSLAHAPGLVPFFDARPWDVLLNFVGFVPFGVLLWWLGWRRARIVLAAGCLSLLLEAAQFCLEHHFATTTDLVVNVAGAWAGTFMLPRPGPAPAPTDPAARG